MSTDILIFAAINLFAIACAYIIGNRSNRGSILPYKPFNLHKMIQSITEKPSKVTSPSKRDEMKAKLNSLTQ